MGITSLVHCRIGSSEIDMSISFTVMLGSLPHRQLRKKVHHKGIKFVGSLPNRQLRKWIS